MKMSVPMSIGCSAQIGMINPPFLYNSPLYVSSEYNRVLSNLLTDRKFGGESGEMKACTDLVTYVVSICSFS